MRRRPSGVAAALAPLSPLPPRLFPPPQKRLRGGSSAVVRNPLLAADAGGGREPLLAKGKSPLLSSGAPPRAPSVASSTGAPLPRHPRKPSLASDPGRAPSPQAVPNPLLAAAHAAVASPKAAPQQRPRKRSTAGGDGATRASPLSVKGRAAGLSPATNTTLRSVISSTNMSFLDLAALEGEEALPGATKAPSD